MQRAGAGSPKQDLDLTQVFLYNETEDGLLEPWCRGSAEAPPCCPLGFGNLWLITHKDAPAPPRTLALPCGAAPLVRPPPRLWAAGPALAGGRHRGDGLWLPVQVSGGLYHPLRLLHIPASTGTGRAGPQGTSHTGASPCPGCPRPAGGGGAHIGATVTRGQRVAISSRVSLSCG